MSEEIFAQRRQKLQTLKDKGVNAYGARFEFTGSLKSVADAYEEGKVVLVCGRIMAIRTHGKSNFLDIKDSTAKLQLYIKKDKVSENTAVLFDNLDIGDFIGAKGGLFKTKTGEITVVIEELTLLSKSLNSMPEKWHGLKDVETRYRQRYLDLISNDEVKEVFIKRGKIINAVREFLNEKGYLEVETPMMHQIAGGAAGKPFKTHLNVYNMDLYLRIAPELYLKRLLVGGYEKIYEINRSFRNEGVSTRHNPEFTMLEVYSAYADYNVMMELTENLFSYAAKKVLGTDKIIYQGVEIDLTPPWPRVSFAKEIGFSAEDSDTSKLKIRLKEKFGEKVDKMSRMQILKLSEELISSTGKNKPTFVIDYFTEMCPLSKSKPDNPLLAERFELFIGGMEVANAYSELNDPVEQKQRFIAQQKEKDEETAEADFDFVEALEYGMPPAGGLGIGIDRMVMILCDQASIRDVILFPQLKPEQE